MPVIENPRSARAPFKAVKVSEHVYWVGAIDWTLRDFHGYTTHHGTTYNAFLILAEKITLIDTVKAPFRDELLARIASLIDPTQIDFIISNHAEMDHSGCLPDLIELIKPEKVFASVMGAKALADHFHLDREITAVKDGERLSLGSLQVSFIETRMLHWPDSMFTYLEEEGVLFTNDAFGMHLASLARFDDQIDERILEHEARTYFANILRPYSALVTKLLERVGGMHLPIQALATDHGPIWRERIPSILSWYGQWAEQRPANKAVIVYDTMWHSTARMAEAIAEGLTASGSNVCMMPLGAFTRSDVATELLGAGALLVGSPTLNNHMLPAMADVMTYVKGLRPQQLIGAAFGSYGWGGEAISQLREMLTAMKVEPVGEDIKVKYVPDRQALTQCYALGVSVAERLQALPKE